MNVAKRSKKPAFLKVFERTDEKEDNPLLHSSSASLFSSNASTDLDLPPMFRSSLCSTAEEAHDEDADDISDEESEDDFVVSNYDSDAEFSTPGNNLPAERKTSDAKTPRQTEDYTKETALHHPSPDNNSPTHRPKEDEFPIESLSQRVRTSDPSVSDSRMDSQVFSEHSESFTMNDDLEGTLPSRKDGMVIDNSVQVPDTLVKHAKASAAAAAAATSKLKERRSHRLLSGAKGLLRVGLKGSTSPKAPKVELEAAVRKVSAGESAKSFAQFSLEEVVPGTQGNRSSRQELLIDRDDLGDHDSDDDSDEKSKLAQLDMTSSQLSPRVMSSPEETAAASAVSEEPMNQEDINHATDKSDDPLTARVSPRRTSERRSKVNSEETDREAERRARRRNPASRSMRQHSVKEPSLGINARRERQRSVRSADTTSSKESGESHGRRRTQHRSRDSHEEKIDELAEAKEHHVHNHKSSRQDRRKSELRPRKERNDRLVENKHGKRADKDLTEVVVENREADPGSMGTATEDCQSNTVDKSPVPLSPSSRLDPVRTGTDRHALHETSQVDPSTPQPSLAGRLNDLIRKDRACKTTESPNKRRSFAKSFSDRFLSASVSPSVETISSTAAVAKHHRKIATTDDLDRRKLASINLTSIDHLDQEIMKHGIDKSKVKKISQDSSERTERSPNRRSKQEAEIGHKSPKRISSNKDKKSSTENHSARNRDGHSDAEVNIGDCLSLDTRRESPPTKFVFDEDEDSREMDPMIVDGHGYTSSPQSTADDIETAMGMSSRLNTEPEEIIKGDEPVESPAALPSNETATVGSVSRRTRQHSINSSMNKPNDKKRASSPRPRVYGKDESTSAQQSPSRGSGVTRRNSRSASIYNKSLERSPENVDSPTVTRLAPADRPQTQDVVFTWRRNLPSQTTSAPTRRTSRSIRQGSIRAVDEKVQVSTALAKAFAVGFNSFSRIMDAAVEPSQTAQVDILSEELWEEYKRLSIELEASRARIEDSKATVLALQNDISSLTARLERVELGARK